LDEVQNLLDEEREGAMTAQDAEWLGDHEVIERDLRANNIEESEIERIMRSRSHGRQAFSVTAENAAASTDTFLDRFTRWLDLDDSF
jgi:hypothetical protein